MNLYHIEAFLALAETLHFTKASELLHTTQPNLSRILLSMEQEVGVKLFHRSKRGVMLTPAGVVFREDMEKLLRDYRAAVERAQDMAHGIHGKLDIGFLGTASLFSLPRAISRFREYHPDILLNLTDYSYSALMDALEGGGIDIAIVPDRQLENKRMYAKKLLYKDDMCLVVNRTHPLAARKEIDLHEVRDEDFVMMDPKLSRCDYNLVSDICIQQDFTPRLAHTANTLTNLIMMIACGSGISILARHMLHFATDEVVFIPIKGYEGYFHVSCVWQEGRNPCVPHFLAVLEEQLQLPSSSA